MKLSIIIEFEYAEEEGCVPFSEEWSTSDIEKATHRSLKQFMERAGLTVSHIEAANGSLKEASGSRSTNRRMRTPPKDELWGRCEMTPTPRPWRADPASSVVGSGIRSDHKLVAVVIPQLDKGETEANAALIVCAVNSHDELLEACKAALIVGVHSHVGEMLKAAIAKAEGRS